MRRIGLGLFIIGITFAKAYGQEDYGPVNTGAANYLTIPADARSAAMGGVGVAAPGGDHAVFHNGAAALSDVTRRGGVAYTYSPWMRDYESGYSLHSLGSFYKIPFDNKQDFEDATRGFIATIDEPSITDETGKEVYGLTVWDFLRQETPASANPSLWRQGQLNRIHGLFEVLPGKIYQIRGFDLANMTFIRSDNGWIVIDVMDHDIF